MKLRSFRYLNTKILDEYMSAIDGYTYDEEAQEISKSSTKNVGGQTKVPIVKGELGHEEKHEEGVRRSVRISDAAKFDRVYTYLESGEDEHVQYWESISDEKYNELRRDDFLEVLVTARFSKMKSFTNVMKTASELATMFEPFMDKKVIDKKTSDAINGLSRIEEHRSEKGTACVFEFPDKKYPLVAQLNEEFFRCKQENFVGEAYLLCKVIRKIEKGQKIRLDEVFEDIQNMPLNREQRRKIKKGMDNPIEIRDEIKGPALVVLPIAVYQ